MKIFSPEFSRVPDLCPVFNLLNPAFKVAAQTASAELTRLHVRHILVGGLAVSAYTRPRTTDDIDFLVGREAWPTHNNICSPIAGLPFRIGKIPIDNILAPPEIEAEIEEAYTRAPSSEGIPIAPLDVLIRLKEIAGRPQDRVDLAALQQCT